jgi:Flp pilus assembly pilin Flp
MLNDLLLRGLAATASARARTRDESGQTLAEYGLIITVIAVGLVLLAMMVFRDALAGAFNAATGCLDSVC